MKTLKTLSIIFFICAACFLTVVPEARADVWFETEFSWANPNPSELWKDGDLLYLHGSGASQEFLEVEGYQSDYPEGAGVATLVWNGGTYDIGGWSWGVMDETNYAKWGAWNTGQLLYYFDYAPTLNLEVVITKESSVRSFHHAKLIETAITGWALSGYGTTQYDLLSALYDAGTGTQVIGDITWEYSASGTKGVNGTDLYGYDYFIGLGSGLGGNGPLEGGGVPEPATVVGLGLMVIAAGLRKLKKA